MEAQSIKANIKISKQLAEKALTSRAIKNACLSSIKINLWLFFCIASLSMLVNIAYQHPELIKLNLLVYLIFFSIRAVIQAKNAVQKYKKVLNDYSFECELTNDGVTLNHSKSFVPWSMYKGYTEFEDYLQISHANGELSLLPKEEQLISVIEYTKSKIPRIKK